MTQDKNFLFSRKIPNLKAMGNSELALITIKCSTLSGGTSKWSAKGGNYAGLPALPPPTLSLLLVMW